MAMQVGQILTRTLTVDMNRQLRMSNDIVVRYMVAPCDLINVYAFRYSVYVSEMNLQPHFVDHEKKRLKDPLDDQGFVYAAITPKNEIVGTVRVNLFTDDSPMVRKYAELYQILDYRLDECSMNTRLMIRSDFRATDTLKKLVTTAYACSLANGISYNFVDCQPKNQSVAALFGYKPHVLSVSHPEFGNSVVMKLRLSDAVGLDADLLESFSSTLRSRNGKESQ